MEYSDWVESTKSKRVWLEDSMTALCQFAYVNPIHKVMHWDAEQKRRTTCLKGKYERCSTCDKGVQIIHDYTYGIYTTNGDKTIRYISTALSSHTNFQQSFKDNLKANVNPCDVLYKVRKGKITTPKGYETTGYDVEVAEGIEPFVAEKDRPSPFQEGKWIIPRMVAEGLTDIDRRPYNLIDLYTEMKERFPNIEDKQIKEYAILLGDGGVVDLRKAKEETWET
jgi:hypothetical protein